MNPHTDMLTLPRFDEVAPETIGPALGQLMADQIAVSAQVATAAPVQFDEVWLPLERAETDLNAMWSTVSHLVMVADTPALRDAYVEAQGRLAEHRARIGQRRDLFDVLSRLAETPAFAGLDEADRAAVHHAIRNFRLTGVALDPDARERFAQNAVERASLSTAFANAVLDATGAWTRHIDDDTLLAGLSPADKAMLSQAAKERGLSGWLVTLQPPHIHAILTFADDRGLREQVYAAYHTRASDRGPHAGRFDNGPRIARLTELRDEAAALLGYPTAVHWLLSNRIADNPERIEEFLLDLARRAKPAAIRELAELRAFAGAELAIDELQPWDISFASEKLRQARFAIAEAELRPYFPIDRVVDGVRDLLDKVYGVDLRVRPDVIHYRPGVDYFDVIDRDGTVIAGLYADLYARSGKRGGAWMSAARPRLADGGRQSKPVAYLVANFAPSMPGAPSLLAHDDITTLLHEIGHCLHHVLTRVDRPSVGGIADFEWDAVELPSQLMENFAWDRDVLAAMSGHVVTGERLPPDLVERLTQSRHFQSGLALLRQIELALFDLYLHLGTFGRDPLVVLDAVRREVAVVHPPEWSRFPHSFSHIFAGGYAAGYYSYLWAEILAADAFETFAGEGLPACRTGATFRTEVLARGASRPAMDSFRAFKGRAPDPGALLRQKGLT